MKKLVLLALITFSYYLNIAQVDREIVILEGGTGVTCPYCPGSAMGLEDLYANGDPVAAIEYHNYGSSQFNSPQSAARCSYYAISGYPTMQFDGEWNEAVGGSSSQSLYGTYLPFVESRMEIQTSFTVELNGSNDGDDYDIIVTVEKVGDYSNNDLTVHLVLTESHIDYNWLGMTTVDFCQRDMYPGANGTGITLEDVGDDVDVELSFTFNNSWDINNCELIAFVQDENTKEILHGAKVMLADLTQPNDNPHFQTVWTSNPYQPMSIIVNSAAINGLNLQAGDEIGVFDVDGTGNEICVGAIVLEDSITSDNPVIITTSADDGDGNGFTPGNSILYKLWNAEGQTEFSNINATYDQNFDEVFTTFGTALVSLNASGHFQPVWSNNPYQPMSFIITAADVDGQNLGAGDEIGIFDLDDEGSEYCVGAGYLYDLITSETPMVVIASSDDPTTDEIDGFVCGNEIHYKFYKADEQIELNNTVPDYDPAFDDQFSCFGTALLSLSAITSVTQTIELNGGWNIMSFFVIPDTIVLIDMLQPLVNDGSLIKVIDESGGFIQDIPGVGWMNTIGDMANTEGYYIKVSEDTQISSTGTAVDLPYDIPLFAGWNIIGYPVDAGQDAMAALEELINDDNLIKVISETGGFIQDIPGVGWMNTIGNFEPGEGYYMKVGNSTSLTLDTTTTSWQCGDSITDPRDGQVYAIVQIGTQCWLAENLNVGTRIDGANNQTANGVIEKYCYDDDEANCDTYGGLYQWAEMVQYLNGVNDSTSWDPVPSGSVQGICPNGWHLPTDEEWKILEGNTDTQYGVGDPEWNGTGYRGYDVGKHLKSTTGWYSNMGTNTSGFSALPGASRNSSGYFYDLSINGNWWSGTESGPTTSWHRGLFYNVDEVRRYSHITKNYGFSVRCVKD